MYSRPVGPGGRPVLGRVDVADWTRLEGWAFDPATPDEPVALEILDNGVLVTRLKATQFRADLLAAGLGRGYCAFSVTIPGGWSPLSSHILRVRPSGCEADLNGSPRVLTPEPAPGTNLRGSLADSLESIGAHATPEQREQALRLLVLQVDALLRARVEAGGPPLSADEATFFSRWSVYLPGQPPPRRPPSSEPAAIARRALVIVEKLRDGVGDLFVAARSYEPEIHVIAATGRTGAQPDWPGITCHGPPYTASVEEFLVRQAGTFDTVLLESASLTLRYAALLRRHQPLARIVLCALTPGSARLDDLAVSASDADLAEQARRRRVQETIAIWSADTIVVASPAIGAAVLELVAGAKVTVMDVK